MSACLKNETLLAFVDREMTPADSELAEKHVAACSACQQQLEGIRASSLKVNALLSSLAPDGEANAGSITVIRLQNNAANPAMRWAIVGSVGVLAATLLLSAMIRRPHIANPPDSARTATFTPAPEVEKKTAVVATIVNPVHTTVPKVPAKVRQFQALDNGAPIETGMIYRVSLPASASSDSSATQSAKRIPAEVIVDEFGKVRAIRFLQ